LSAPTLPSGTSRSPTATGSPRSRRAPRLVLGLSSCAVALTLLIAASATAAADTDWTGLQGGPSHLGAAPGTPAPPYRVGWTLRAPGARSAFSGAVVVGGLALATTQTSVVAFDAATGERRWTVRRATGSLVPPAVAPSADAGGIAVVVEGVDASKAGIVGIDLKARARAWRVRLGAAAIAAPTVEGATAYVGARDRFVYALDAATGQVRWKARTVGTVDSAPAVAGGKVFVVARDPSTLQARVYALDAATGKVVWTDGTTAAAEGTSAVTVADGRAYVAFADSVRALDAETGAQVWSEPVGQGSSPFTAPAVDADSVFALDAGGDLYRLDRRTGRRIWDFQFSTSRLLFAGTVVRGDLQAAGAPVVIGGRVLAGLSNGTVGAIDVASGELVWETAFADTSVGPLAVAGGRILAPVVSSHGRMVALERDPSGHLVRRESPSRLHLPVAAANFAVAAVAVLAVVLGGFGLLGRLGSGIGSWRGGAGRGDAATAGTAGTSTGEPLPPEAEADREARPAGAEDPDGDGVDGDRDGEEGDGP
jgi:outer membrane protein assembly factor BamB